VIAVANTFQEVSKARYIVEQYVAAAGGEAALSAAKSMYAMGKVRMRTTKGQKAKTGMGVVSGGEVAGGFVLWQKRQQEQWCVEMVVAGGTKMSAGSDGNVAWRRGSRPTPAEVPQGSFADASR
jgi:hypothetical protein